MTHIDHDEPGVPVTADDEVADNIERIRSYETNGSTYMSTSQQIMVGLALCRPDLLAQANYPASKVKAAWARLDDSQRQAVVAWWK